MARKKIDTVVEQEPIVEEMEIDVPKVKSSKQSSRKDADVPDSLKDLYSQISKITERKDEFVKSGILALDAVLSNGEGIPLGTFIEIASESGGGKSTLFLHVAKNLCGKGYRCIYIDAEAGLNSNQLESFGLTKFVEQQLFIPAKYNTFEDIEEFLNKITEDDNAKFIFFDSITAAMPRKLLERSLAESAEPGVHARMVSLFLQKFKAKLRDSGKTMFFISQMRTKIAMGYGQVTKTDVAGGNAMQYYQDIRLQMKAKYGAVREMKVKGCDKPVPYGVDNVIFATKNRFCAPKIPIDITIIFGKGVSNSAANYRCLESNGYIKQSGSMYKIIYNDEWVDIRGKANVENYIKENNAYYTQLVNRLGGIKLVQEGNALIKYLDDEAPQDISD